MPKDLSQYMPRTARYDAAGSMVMATTDKGNVRLCDIRGWGHYTGHGQAWGLDPETARAIQDEIGTRIAQLWNGHKQPDLDAALQAAWELSTWAACINWRGTPNEKEWLDDLRDKIERSQTLLRPFVKSPTGMNMQPPEKGNDDATA